MSNTIKVKAEYTFECIREVKAEDYQQALEYVQRHCGAISPDYHSSLPYKDVERD